MDFTNRRITIMGLGRHGGGIAAARRLARLGGRVTVTDVADEKTLLPSIESLSDVPIWRYRLGGHDEIDFREAEWVVVNPAVPPGNRYVEIARAAGAQITTDIDLLIGAIDARMVAVTGTTGKSTTATMIAEVLRGDGRTVYLGGNIGQSLLDKVEAIRQEDIVVLELSSFQLARLSDRFRRPEIAVVTNCTANHLDWHGTFGAYRAAKQRLVDGPIAARQVILGPGDGGWADWPVARERLVEAAACLERVPTLRVPGEHNRANAACAIASADLLGCGERGIGDALATFSGLPHRIETVVERDGVRWIDDSKATAPEATIAALRCFGDGVWLLAGGYDKGADFGPLAEEIVRRVRGVAFFGSAGARLAEEVLCRSDALLHTVVGSMDGAIMWCRSRREIQAGETVLLSPGCSSFDQFVDYIERGKRFVEQVK